jgi:type I restriction enzyme S subunit
MSKELREYKLEDLLLDVQPGFARKPSQSGNALHLRTNNISPDGQLDLSELKYVYASNCEIEKYSLAQDDVLFNNTNSDIWVGKTAYVDRALKALYSNHLTRLRVDKSKVEPQFLAMCLHKLQKDGFFKSKSTRWVNQTAINTKMLRTITLNIPPLEYQRKAVAVLLQADGLKQKREQANIITNKFLQTVFLQMFGDPLGTHTWGVLKLSQVGTLARGKSKHRPRNAPELLGGKYPLIQTGDVANSGGYITQYSQTYSEMGLKQSKLWPKGTLCITIAANIAATGILTFDTCFPDSIVGFIPNEHVTTEYVQYWLSFLRKKLETTAPQVAQKNINLRILSNLDIPTPPIELQIKFSSIALKIEQLQRKQKYSSQEIAGLFNSLMSKAFKGEYIA